MSSLWSKQMSKRYWDLVQRHLPRNLVDIPYHKARPTLVGSNDLIKVWLLSMESMCDHSLATDKFLSSIGCKQVTSHVVCTQMIPTLETELESTFTARHLVTPTALLHEKIALWTMLCDSICYHLFKVLPIILWETLPLCLVIAECGRIVITSTLHTPTYWATIVCVTLCARNDLCRYLLGNVSALVTGPVSAARYSLLVKGSDHHSRAVLALARTHRHPVWDKQM